MKSGWGNFPKLMHDDVIELNWRDQSIPFNTEKNFLVHAQGRSYGDSCLNENGILISTRRLNRLMDFDKKKGTLTCEAGIMLSEILDFIIPHGWFLPVLPGTQWVSLGGAIANDVHGKNHHRSGTFGNHVLTIELLRSTGERILCLPSTDLHQATIGGLGLTGIILSATLQLKPISSVFLSVEHIPFKNITEFFSLSEQSEKEYEYTVAWIDCISSGKQFGRGVFMRANHAENALLKIQRNSSLSVPFYFPSMTLNRFTVKAFNDFYFYRQANKKPREVYYEKFFFPLDSINHWNKIYGKKGFVQYQCVLPEDHRNQIEALLKKIVSSGQSSFLSVLKTFGDTQSPGLLSFPMKGVTLAIDLPYRGMKTQRLLNELDESVMQYGGKIYPAKDATMSAKAFQTYFPTWKTFSTWMDPKFSSSLWRRVTT